MFAAGLIVRYARPTQIPAVARHIFMTVVKLFVFFLLITSCNGKADNEQERGVKNKLSFELPEGWRKREGRGIDSDVGIITNGKDTVNYDYGWHSGKIDSEDTGRYLIRIERIGGLVSLIGMPKVYSDIPMAMYTQVSGKNKFRIEAKKVFDTAAVLEVFRSVRFLSADTLANSNWARLNIGYQSGKFLFASNCASCHSLTLDATGPALQGRMTVRDSDWIFRFLTDRKSIKQDSARIELQARYKSICNTFPSLTNEGVRKIIDYVEF
jgi:hypothetical protein